MLNDRTKILLDFGTGLTSLLTLRGMTKSLCVVMPQLALEIYVTDESFSNPQRSEDGQRREHIHQSMAVDHYNNCG